MKRVLILMTGYMPFVGGAEIAVREITDRMPDVAFHMITVNLDGKQKKVERMGNIRVYRLGRSASSKFFLPFTGFLKARALFRKYSYDTIWTIMASQASIAASFLKMSLPGSNLVLSVQEGDEEEHLKRYVMGIDPLYRLFIRPWHVLVFKKADRITALSNHLRLRARALNPVVPIDVIPNGVDLERFSTVPTEDALERARDLTRKRPGDRMLITTSRLVVKNAVGDLIEALKFLPPFVKLAVIGTGLLEDELRAQTSRLELSDRVTFLGDRTHSEIPALLKASDVFVRPSLSEGMGNSFIEAMAAGIPVIGTNVGGIPEFLREGQTGLFCQPKDPQSIASAVQRLIVDEQLKSRIVSTAAALVQDKYGWGAIVDRMRRILTERPPRP